MLNGNREHVKHFIGGHFGRASTRGGDIARQFPTATRTGKVAMGQGAKLVRKRLWEGMDLVPVVHT